MIGVRTVAAARAWIADRRGVAGLEFALSLPVLAVLAIVAFDLARYTIYVRKAHLAASTMANLIARNDTGTINQNDLDAIFQTQLVVFPEIMKAARDRNQWVWATVLSSLSGIQFKTLGACGVTCVYVPYVAWTSGQGRPCGTPLIAAPAAAAPSPSTIPADIFGSGFLIVADVSFVYVPIFLRSVVGTVTIRRSFYIAPRYVTSIAYSAAAGSSFTWGCTIP